MRKPPDSPPAPALSDRLPVRPPPRKALLLTYRAGLTAYLRFPAEHHHRIRHSNLIESTFGETAAPKKR